MGSLEHTFKWSSNRGYGDVSGLASCSRKDRGVFLGQLTFLDLLTAEVTIASAKALPELGTLKETIVHDGSVRVRDCVHGYWCSAHGYGTKFVLVPQLQP